MKSSSVYLLVGEDNFLKNEFVGKVKKRFLDESNRELNFTSLSARDSKVEDILAIARTAPFLCKKRVVVIKDVDKLDERGKDALLLFVKNPTESTYLILDSTKRLSDSEFLNRLSKYAVPIRTQAASYGALEHWIKEKASSFKKRITLDAIRLLEELVGDNFELLSRELEKTVSFIGQNNEITVGDVQAVVGKSIKEDIFVLMDYIASKDVWRALVLCKRLLQQGRRSHEIIGLIGWQFRKLLLVKLALQRGEKKEIVFRELGLRRFYLKRFNLLLDNFKTEELKEKLKLLFIADRSIKTSSLKPEFVLDVLVSRLCVT